jgi:hypothetical protein
VLGDQIAVAHVAQGRLQRVGRVRQDPPAGLVNDVRDVEAQRAHPFEQGFGRLAQTLDARRVELEEQLGPVGVRERARGPFEGQPLGPSMSIFTTAGRSEPAPVAVNVSSVMLATGRLRGPSPRVTADLCLPSGSELKEMAPS